MNIWEFFDNHYLLAFFALCSIYYTFRETIRRLTSLMRVSLRDWPPHI